jgi:hypothetical protein
VSYVLSDKTGTLTQNVMGFVWASFGGSLYGKVVPLRKLQHWFGAHVNGNANVSKCLTVPAPVSLAEAHPEATWTHTFKVSTSCCSVEQVSSSSQATSHGHQLRTCLWHHKLTSLTWCHCPHLPPPTCLPPGRPTPCCWTPPCMTPWAHTLQPWPLPAPPPTAPSGRGQVLWQSLSLAYLAARQALAGVGTTAAWQPFSWPAVPKLNIVSAAGLEPG